MSEAADDSDSVGLHDMIQVLEDVENGETLQGRNIKETYRDPDTQEERIVQGTQHTYGPFRVYENLILNPIKKSRNFQEIVVMQHGNTETFHVNNIQLQDEIFQDEIIEDEIREHEIIEEDKSVPQNETQYILENVSQHDTFINHEKPEKNEVETSYGIVEELETETNYVVERETESDYGSVKDLQTDTDYDTIEELETETDFGTVGEPEEKADDGTVKIQNLTITKPGTDEDSELEEVKLIEENETLEEDESRENYNLLIIRGYKTIKQSPIYIDSPDEKPEYLSDEFLDEETLQDDDGDENSLELKVETEEPCPTCLSVGRDMRRLEPEAAGTYSMLLAGFYEKDQIDEFVGYSRVCWECRQGLRRVRLFQLQLLEANDRLQEYQLSRHRQATSLSRLSAKTHRGFDYSITLTEPDSPPKRKRGRPRKHPLPSPPLGKPLPALYRKQAQGSPPSGSVRRKKKEAKPDGLRRGKRNPKFIKVTIDDAELENLRATSRESEDFVLAAYRCETCLKGFSFINLLEKHNRTKHSEEAGPHECNICEVRFPDAAAMTRHRRRHYTLYSCSACGFTSPFLAVMETHYTAAHDPTRTFPCSQCGKVFQKEREMRYHKEMKHKPLFQCDYCSKLFRNMQVFRAHIKIHTGMPTLVCSICQKSCRGETGLYAHMRTYHSEENPADAVCQECGIQFRNKDGLKFHLRHSVKHATPAQLKFPCEQCSKRFLSEKALKQHHAYYHLEYKCDICDKRLNSRFTFSKHMKFLHQGHVLPKKHICEVCGKAFKTKVQLRTHDLTHSGLRPHSCELCGASFAQKSTLRTHTYLIHLKYGRSGQRAANTADN